MAEAVVLPENQIERLSLFFPIKVVNGFVTCDFMLGCYCCNFCLNRRYPDWQRLLERQRIYRNTLQVAQAGAVLKSVRAFTHAKVTLKLGHDTDMSLEEIEAQQLYDFIPPDQPIVFMRRGKLLPKYRPFYLQARPNLMVELTITPRSQRLDYQVDPFEVLRSFEGLAVPLFYTVGPLCEDNFDEAKAILEAIPAGSKVWVRELIVKDIPTYAASSPESPAYKGEALREFAAQRGLSVIHYLNCVVRANLGLVFHKRGEFVSEPNSWQLRWCEVCKVKEKCDLPIPEEEEQTRIHTALDDLHLTLAQPLQKFEYKSYNVMVNEEVNFGDEAYLREMTTLKVDLAKKGRKTGTALSASIAARWRECAFFPVDEVLQLAQESYQIAFQDQ